MIKSDIKYLVMSDLHFLKKGKTFTLLENIDKFFDNYSNNSILTKIDIIFFAGDVFDHILNILSGELSHIIYWFKRFISFCDKHNIIVRILEGTPIHDWKQSSIFTVLHECMHPNVDFKYIDILCIENIEKFNLNILYVPDKWNTDSEITFNEVKKELTNKNLNIVDIAIMHGMFTYQLKGLGIEKEKHKEENYLPIVKYYISIGHIHDYSFFDRIIAQGSFDEHSFGSEIEKGCTMMTIKQNGEMSYDFLVNKNSIVYKKIKLPTNDLTKNYEIIKNCVRKHGLGNYRLVCKKDNPIISSYKKLSVDFEGNDFSVEVLDEEKKIEKKEIKQLFCPVNIDKKNILGLLLSEINDDSIKEDNLTTELNKFL